MQDIFVVNAFAEAGRALGNPAAVVPLEAWWPDDLMARVAAQNNLSETAFLVPISTDTYRIRWFSPLTEIDFCGHATLAAALVCLGVLGGGSEVQFLTEQVGELRVRRLPSGLFEMDFPQQAPAPVSDPPAALMRGLPVPPRQVLRNRQAYFAVYDDQDTVTGLQPDLEQLRQLAPYDVVVTAPARGAGFDIVSRYFWPANGRAEDPVTGSIHTGLVPYWSAALGRSPGDPLTCWQASQRGGVLHCRLAGERVIVAGHGELYLRGHIFV